MKIKVILVLMIVLFIYSFRIDATEQNGKAVASKQGEII